MQIVTIVNSRHETIGLVVIDTLDERQKIEYRINKGRILTICSRSAWLQMKSRKRCRLAGQIEYQGFYGAFGKCIYVKQSEFAVVSNANKYLNLCLSVAN